MFFESTTRTRVTTTETKTTTATRDDDYCSGGDDDDDGSYNVRFRVGGQFRFRRGASLANPHAHMHAIHANDPTTAV